MAVNSEKSVRDFPKWPDFGDEEILAVSNVLASGRVNYWTGEECRSFEREFAGFIGCEYAIALANGTVALELALAALGIGAGDEVIVTSYTFIASASAVVMRGAIPIIADVDRETLNISADTVRGLVTSRTKAIIAVHLVGQPCDMDPLLELSREFDLKMIEDCAQAHGAVYKGKLVGSLGDVAAFSFCQDKIMSTGGEGGMLTTNKKSLWEYAWAYKDHGKNYDAVYSDVSDVKGSGFRWLHDSFGTNWRMTEMQAAIGRIQLRKLPEWLRRRRRNAEVLSKEFAGINGLRVPEPLRWIEHAYYKYYVFVVDDELRNDWNRDRILSAIDAEGIPCFSGICAEIYREKAFVNAGYGPCERLPIAQKCGESSLLFLVHPTLGNEEMMVTVDVVRKIMAMAARPKLSVKR